MSDLIFVIDASGSLLTWAHAEIAWECLRFFAEESLAHEGNVFLWRDNIEPLDLGIDRSIREWESLFHGGTRLDALTEFLKNRDMQSVIISDGYAFQDASESERHAFYRLKTKKYLLMLEQDRVLARANKVFSKDNIFDVDSIMALAGAVDGYVE